MRTLIFSALLLAVALTGLGQVPRLDEGLISQLQTGVPDTAFCVREDWTVFGTAFIWTVQLDSSSHMQVIMFPDASLVGSREAHDDAVVKARTQNRWQQGLIDKADSAGRNLNK